MESKPYSWTVATAVRDLQTSFLGFYALTRLKHIRDNINKPEQKQVIELLPESHFESKYGAIIRQEQERKEREREEWLKIVRKETPHIKQMKSILKWKRNYLDHLADPLKHLIFHYLTPNDHLLSINGLSTSQKRALENMEKRGVGYLFIPRNLREGGFKHGYFEGLVRGASRFNLIVRQFTEIMGQLKALDQLMQASEQFLPTYDMLYLESKVALKYFIPSVHIPELSNYAFPPPRIPIINNFYLHKIHFTMEEITKGEDQIAKTDGVQIMCQSLAIQECSIPAQIICCFNRITTLQLIRVGIVQESINRTKLGHLVEQLRHLYIERVSVISDIPSFPTDPISKRPLSLSDLGALFFNSPHRPFKLTQGFISLSTPLPNNPQLLSKFFTNNMTLKVTKVDMKQLIETVLAYKGACREMVIITGELVVPRKPGQKQGAEYRGEGEISRYASEQRVAFQSMLSTMQIAMNIDSLVLDNEDGVAINVSHMQVLQGRVVDVRVKVKFDWKQSILTII
ncbi:hypothetical protein FGO68_gene15646 [Halteria grandinella]|uniref:Uncharacterized protein n=1 Tax=Halteria grandinella TaxID=5974 RepID=A0A8J8NT04_HALGN|nr:hypothetical protein FGO68_gene15646 [Halteria grandinella]